MSKTSNKRKAGKAIRRTGSDYNDVLAGVVELLDAARRASARVVNSLMTATYWEVGRQIVEHEQAGQKRADYGEELIQRFSLDLTRRFGRGFGVVQVSVMRQFFLAFPNAGIFQSVIKKSSADVPPPTSQSTVSEFARRSSAKFARAGAIEPRRAEFSAALDALRASAARSESTGA